MDFARIALEVDFAARRPSLVTQILARCACDGERDDEIWRWTVPQRTQALLAITRDCGIAIGGKR